MTTQPIHRVFHSMGIAVHLTLIGVTNELADKLTHEAEHIFHTYDERFSRFKDTSELMMLNQSGGKAHKVSIELFQMLKKCVALAEKTDGVFDPSVGGVLASYGYGLPENFTLPTPLPTYRDIVFNDRELEVTLAPGQILEPANIVKGIAIDEAGRALAGTPGFMINAGGDILTRGAFGNGRSWNIAIQDPRDPRAIVTTMSLQNAGIATSGSYQTHGKSWHHIINMRTGESTHGITSATVIAPTCEEADTEASLTILLGPIEGITRLERLGLPYFIILDDGTIRKNTAFATLEVSLPSIA